MPDNSNTQLLWYRKDLVPRPPTTWAQMIQDAVKLAKEGKPHYIEVQGKPVRGPDGVVQHARRVPGRLDPEGPVDRLGRSRGAEGGGDHPRRRHVAGGRSVAVELR